MMNGKHIASTESGRIRARGTSPPGEFRISRGKEKEGLAYRIMVLRSLVLANSTGILPEDCRSNGYKASQLSHLELLVPIQGNP